jgi:vitamin B12 transporter
MVYRVGPVGINAGARYDYDSSFGKQLSPSLGLNVNLLKSTIFRLTLARTFKVPDLWITVGESYYDLILPNPNLVPERAWAYSAGIETQELRYIWLKGSLYRSDMTDGIVIVPSEEHPGRLTWANETKFRKQGYEVELGFLTPFGITGYVAQNHNDHKNVTGGSIIRWIPTTVKKAGLKYKNDKLDLLANLRGRCVFWNEDEGLISYFHPKDNEWLVDLIITKGISISPTTHLGVSLNVFNLFNKIAWDRSDSPNPKRWVALSFEVSFK